MGKLSVKEFINIMEKDRVMEVNDNDVFVSNIDERLMLVSSIAQNDSLFLEAKLLGIIDLDKRKYYMMNSLQDEILNEDECINLYKEIEEIKKTINNRIKLKAKKTFPEGYSDTSLYEGIIKRSIITFNNAFLSQDYKLLDLTFGLKEIIEIVKDKDKFIESNVDKYIDYGYQYILAKLNTTKYSLKILKETDNKDMSSETIEICNRRILYFSLKEHEKINIILNYEGEEIACNPLAESVQEICINGSGQLKFKNDIDKPFLKIGLKDCNIQSVDFKDIKMVMFENKIIYEPKDQDELLAYFEKNKKEFQEKYKDHIIEK